MLTSRIQVILPLPLTVWKYTQELNEKRKPRHFLSTFPLPRHLWEGGPGSSEKVNLTVSLQACTEEIPVSSNSRNRKPPLQKFYSTRSPHRRQWWVPSHLLHHSLFCRALRSAKLKLQMPLAYWEVEKMPTDITNKVPEPFRISSCYLFLAFECRTPRNWWVETRFAHPGI